MTKIELREVVGTTLEWLQVHAGWMHSKWICVWQPVLQTATIESGSMRWNKDRWMVTDCWAHGETGENECGGASKNVSVSFLSILFVGVNILIVCILAPVWI